MHATHDESGIADLERSSTFDGLPTGIQKWIRQHSNPFRPPTFDRSLPYIRGVDDTLVFSFKKSGNNGRYDSQTGLAEHYLSNDSVVEYLPEKDEWYQTEAEVKLVGFPENPPYTAWCGVFELMMQKFLQDEAICYNSNSSTLKRFPPLRDDEKSTGHSGGSMDNTLYATNDTLWVALRRRVRRSNDAQNAMITLTTSGC